MWFGIKEALFITFQFKNIKFSSNQTEVSELPRSPIRAKHVL
jgi:hypothetical protein